MSGDINWLKVTPAWRLRICDVRSSATPAPEASFPVTT
jgi:hypothetical protein